MDGDADEGRAACRFQMRPEQMSVLSELVDHARRHVGVVSGAAMDLPEEVTAASEIVQQEIAPTGWALVTTEVLVLFLRGSGC